MHFGGSREGARRPRFETSSSLIIPETEEPVSEEDDSHSDEEMKSPEPKAAHKKDVLDSLAVKTKANKG